MAKTTLTATIDDKVFEFKLPTIGDDIEITSVINFRTRALIRAMEVSQDEATKEAARMVVACATLDTCVTYPKDFGYDSLFDVPSAKKDIITKLWKEYLRFRDGEPETAASA